MVSRLRATREGKPSPLPAGGAKKGGVGKGGAGAAGVGFLKAKSPVLQQAFLASKQRKLFRKAAGSSLGKDLAAE